MLSRNRTYVSSWRIGEKVMRGSLYSYILSIRHYAPNTFLALPNLPNRRILANTLWESQFSQLLINLCENAPECWRIFGIRLFSENWRMRGSTFRLVRCLSQKLKRQMPSEKKNPSDEFLPKFEIQRIIDVCWKKIFLINHGNKWYFENWRNFVLMIFYSEIKIEGAM